MSERASGRSSRMLLRVLLQISEYPKRKVWVIAYSRNYSERLVLQVVDMARLLGWPVEKWANGSYKILESIVTPLSADQVHPKNGPYFFRGMPQQDLNIFEDHRYEPRW